MADNAYGDKPEGKGEQDMEEKPAIDVVIRASAITVAGLDLYMLSFSLDIILVTLGLMLASLLPFVLMHFLHRWRSPKGVYGFFMLPLNCTAVLGLKIWALHEILCLFGGGDRCGDQAGIAAMFIPPALLIISLPLMLLYLFASEKRDRAD